MFDTNPYESENIDEISFYSLVNHIRKYLKQSLIILGLLVSSSFYLGKFYSTNYSQDISCSNEFPSQVDVPNSVEFISVDIGGAVTNPGLVELTNGERLNSAIDIAGPILSEASIEWVSKNLNLATVLKDSQKIYIPFEWELSDLYSQEFIFESLPTNESSSSSSHPSTTNVNTAKKEDLIKLPGIGETFANRIIENRPYIDFSDLKVKAQLTNSISEKIKDLVSF